MTKTLTFTLLLFQALLCFNASASPKDSTTSLVDKAAALLILEEGKNLFFQNQTKDALIKFREAGLKDPLSPVAPLWIARCHYRLDNFGYALKYAKESVIKEDKSPEKDMYDLLGDCYFRMGYLDSALANYESAKAKMTKLRADELMIPVKIEQVKYAMEAGKNPVEDKKVRLTGEVNSGYNDYSPVLTNGGNTLYFVSRRSNTTGGNISPGDQLFFEDVYRAKWNSTTNEWDSVTNELGRINSTAFEAISHISEDGLTALVTLNTEMDETVKKPTKVSDICEVKWTNQGQWSTPKPIKNKTINSSFFDGAATLTADGNTMYFVSDRKGEKSGSDIYVVTKNGNKWGEAKQLPMTINSKGHETTPFITPDGRFLFYSSNGLVGMGGYDVYVVENQGGTWGEPKNLGPSINSVNNETHFKIYDKLGIALMAGTEVVGDKSSIDIYSVSIKLEELVKTK